ncbi:MAG: MSHA biogenesis protein MshL [Gammaproteobacteria bacterium]|jgi:MSHA biogenesis protein MshL
MRVAVTFTLLVALTGCALHAPVDPTVPIGTQTRAVTEKYTPARGAGTPPNIGLLNRLSLPEFSDTTPDESTGRLYSFVAQNLPIQQALQVFREAYKLNIVVDNDITGSITAEFHDLPFDQAMEAMLDSVGLYWEREQSLIRVKSWQTKDYVIDYIRLVRSGSGSSLAQISSGDGGGSGGGDGGDSGGSESGAITIEQNDTVEFWGELEGQLSELVSPEGRLVVNRMSGTVQVSDRFPRVRQIGQYIAEINRAIHRQVDIDVRIVEVTLNDDFSLGVDWSRLSGPTADGLGFNLNSNSIIGQPAGGFVGKLPSLSLDVFNIAGNTLEFSALVDALREQGAVKIVSQPQIRALNNQSAMIKVGTDRTFFRRELSIDTTSAGSTTQSEDIPQVVTEGIVLALTPQISASGWIMLDVSPVITRVSSISQVLEANGQVRSSAPNLDIRQASSLVRVRSGETIVIGGLIQDQESDTERSVPGVSSIPLVGNLFKGNYQVRGKKELVMFLTARLVNTPDLTASR